MIYFQLYQSPVQILYVLSIVCFKESFSIEGKYTKNVNNYKIVYPVRVTGPDQSSRRYRRWEGDEDSATVHYQLNLEGDEECIIDLEPNLHILSSGAVLERRTGSAADNDPLANVQVEQPSYTQCFFKGKVRNYDDSSTALSTCGGLYGYIRVKRRTYLIEPIVKQVNETEQEQPHIIYEDELNDTTAHNCATNLKRDAADNASLDDSFPRTNTAKCEELCEEEAATNSSNKKRLHIETMLVMDQSMMDMHEAADLQNYALTVFNMAQSLFHDLSTDPAVDLEIVRIIEVEDPKDVLNARQNRQLGTDELETFSDWQLKINPKDEMHPCHHDLAILLTGNEICDEDNSCQYVGLAETNGACRPSRQAAICKDNGLMLGYSIAHQIAHTLGVGHDPAVKSPEGTSSVMSPIITLGPKVWSEESRGALLSAIKNEHLNCLEDEPASEFKVTDMLPGVMYDADFQCQQLLTPDARSCSKIGDCQSLSCEFDGTSCSNTGVMPAQGTACDTNKWCYDGTCLEAGKRPLAVDGNWGAWSAWSACSRSCGAGVSVSTRECNSPSPMHGGKSCSGSRNRHKICTTEPCDVESQPFRDVQCAEYNDWVFPEDGAMHKWKGFFVSNDNPCALYCRNEKDVIVSLSPKVKDGTTCYRGMRDICVDGVCRNIPCDLQFDSNSVEDTCGICHGNGTSCKIVQGKANFQKGVSQILDIPAGTRNIVVEESKHTPSHLLLKSIDKNEIINDGNKLGMFNISGSVAWVGMKKPNQEILEIPGPLVNPVEVWITSEGPQAVTYSMGLPSEPREGKYSWDYLDWSACVAQCGDSYQESVPKCVELLSGHVEDKYCSQLQKPPNKKRSCNAGICLPRWLVGEWQECGPCPSNEARRFRIVRCIKPIAGSEEGTMIVSDEICPGSRPIGSEPCRCIKRQVLYWPSPYRFDMLSNDFKILSKNKGNETSKIPEKKVTLMQLENENEESMLKQFKENQQKHHSIFYMPRVLGSRFNFSIPFKKREAISDENRNQGSLHLSNNNFLDFFPKLDAIDFIKSGNMMMGNTHVQTTQSVKFFSLSGPRDNINSLNVKRLRPISTNDPQPLLFSDQNILKLLSENLPLEKLKQQQNMNRNTKSPFRNYVYCPDIFLNDTGAIQTKEEKKLNFLDILMNEFNNVLAMDTVPQSNTKNPLTTDSDIPSLQGIAIKPKGSVLERRIQFGRQPSFLSNMSSLDEAISRLQMAEPANENTNTSNSFITLKLNNYGGNKHRGKETWIPQNDHEWNKLLSAFGSYFVKKPYDSELKSPSTAISDQQFKIYDNMYFISTEPTKTAATNDNLNLLGSLNRKITEKLNTLSDSDKLRAYQLFTAVVNSLHNNLSGFPQKEHAEKDFHLNDDTPLKEIQLEPTRLDNFENEINKEKSHYFFKRITNDLLRFNRSKNGPFNYSLRNFEEPIFSAEDLLKIKYIFNSGDSSSLVGTINRNEIPQFYQFRKINKETRSREEMSGENNKNAIDSDQRPESNTKSILNHNLDEFITNLISGNKGRNKKEAVRRSNGHRKGRIGRYVQVCPRGTTPARRITGVYGPPSCRICPKTTTSPHPKYALPRCRKNVANISRIARDINKKTFGKELSKKRAIFLPGNNKPIKFTCRKKRFKPCEDSTRICEELMRRFKDRLANATKLDPYSCQRLREEILHVKFNLKSEENLESDLLNVINSNATCIFLYSDEKDTTTPFHF